MPHVGDEQVGLVPGQLGHEPPDPVAGVADRAGVDDFPASRRVGLGQHRAEPAGERGVVEERPAVGGRASQADDPVRAPGFVPEKVLLVERFPLARDERDNLLPRAVGLDAEVRHLGHEPRVGITAVIGRLDAARPEHHLDGGKDPQADGNGERGLLPGRQVQAGRRPVPSRGRDGPVPRILRDRGAFASRSRHRYPHRTR